MVDLGGRGQQLQQFSIGQRPDVAPPTGGGEAAICLFKDQLRHQEVTCQRGCGHRWRSYYCITTADGGSDSCPSFWILKKILSNLLPLKIDDKRVTGGNRLTTDVSV